MDAQECIYLILIPPRMRNSHSQCGALEIGLLFEVDICWHIACNKVLRRGAVLENVYDFERFLKMRGLNKTSSCLSPVTNQYQLTKMDSARKSSAASTRPERNLEAVSYLPNFELVNRLNELKAKFYGFGLLRSLISTLNEEVLIQLSEGIDGDLPLQELRKIYRRF